MELHHGRQSLPSSIFQIVLKGTETCESVISLLWRTQTELWVGRVGYKPEFTFYERVS